MAWCHQLTLVKVMAWNHQVTFLIWTNVHQIITRLLSDAVWHYKGLMSWWSFWVTKKDFMTNELKHWKYLKVIDVMVIPLCPKTPADPILGTHNGACGYACLHGIACHTTISIIWHIKLDSTRRKASEICLRPPLHIYFHKFSRSCPETPNMTNFSQRVTIMRKIHRARPKCLETPNFTRFTKSK